MRCSLSSSTRKRPSGSISSIWPSMTKSSSFATRSGLLEIHGRLFAAPIRLQFIAEALVALERRHAGPCNGGKVEESVAGATFIRDEDIDRKSVVSEKSEQVRDKFGWYRILKK